MKSGRKKTASQLTPIYKLPTEILENIGENLDIADLSRFSRSCSFFYNALQEYKRMRPEISQHNLQHHFCDKRIFQHRAIHAVAKWKNIIVTASWSAITAWDLSTGK